ncbi:MAG: 7-cyano-7-deazaguanine reductase [Gammaproteobacteria bacterium]|jgi:7-cyano-7-deazaguanine reductase
MSSEHLSKSPLGKQSAYISNYDPGQLCPIPRELTWKAYAYSKSPYYGFDIWNAYEISWLNVKGLPQVAIGEFYVPLTSPNLIESKSLKLYLNSFSQTKFINEDKVQKTLVSDLSLCAGEAVKVKLFAVNNRHVDVQEFEGSCIDEIDVDIDFYSRNDGLLNCTGKQVRGEKVYSHLLKTNCPVTGQPDWGSIFIKYSGKSIKHDSLLKYIVSYRNESDFHEHCIEKIFLDIMHQCRPYELTVYARYLRRGGLDINPYRSTENDLPLNFRSIRQ